MRHSLARQIVAAMMVVAIATWPSAVNATTFPSFGNVALVGTATAVAICTLTRPSTCFVQDLAVDPEYCGWTSAVTDATGTKVGGTSIFGAGGGWFAFKIDSIPPGGTATLYCYSATTQSSPADTRWQALP